MAQEDFDHYRSVIAAIDQFLDWLPDMDKEQFVARLQEERQRFKARLGGEWRGLNLSADDVLDCFDWKAAERELSPFLRKNDD